MQHFQWKKDEQTPRYAAIDPLKIHFNIHLFVISITRVTGDSEELHQINAVVLVLSADSPFQQRLSVVIIP